MRSGQGPRTVDVGYTPDRVRLKLTYVDNFELASTTGLALKSYSCNSLHDPDYSGTGHQPQYYDQWFNSVEGNGLYHKYLVRAVEYEITVYNTRTDPTVFCIFPTTHGNVPDVSDSFNAMCEAPWAHVKQLSNSDSGEGQHTFRGKVVISALEGVKLLDPSSYQGTYGSSPGFQPLLTLASRRPDGTNNINTTVSLRLTYVVDGYDRIYSSAED
jgi:hypothetical protein